MAVAVALALGGWQAGGGRAVREGEGGKRERERGERGKRGEEGAVPCGCGEWGREGEEEEWGVRCGGATARKVWER